MSDTAQQPSSPLIYKAIANVMKETKAIAKGEKNTQQNFMFRGIDAVMNELHGLFASNGVFILPEVMEYNVTEKITKGGSILYYTRAKVRYHFTAEDASEVCTINVGEAMDSGDKGMNKAMSAALKYALMQMLLIPTKETKDPDVNSPEETRPQTIAEVIPSLDPVKDSLLIQALNDIIAAPDKKTLVQVWNGYCTQLSQHPVFTQCMTARRKELGI